VHKELPSHTRRKNLSVRQEKKGNSPTDIGRVTGGGNERREERKVVQSEGTDSLRAGRRKTPRSVEKRRDPARKGKIAREKEEKAAGREGGVKEPSHPLQGEKGL